MTKLSMTLLENEPEPKRKGRPAYEASEKDRKQVTVMSGIGLTHDQIAKILGVSDETLRKYYGDELDTGASKMNAQVAQNLFSIATSKGPGSVPAAIFWMKTRARWQEVSRNEITGKDGGPVQIEAKTIQADQLDEDALDAIEMALAAAVEAE